MRELKIDDFRNVRALARTLVGVTPNPSYGDPSTVQLKRDIDRSMRRKPFRVFSFPSPIATTVEDFITTEIAREMVSALDTFVRLLSFGAALDGPHFNVWGNDLALWTDLCPWTEYLCLFSDNSASITLTPGRVGELLFRATESVVNVLHCIAMISPVIASSVAFAFDCAVIRTTVRMYLYWPVVYGDEPEDDSKLTRALVCSSTLPTLNRIMTYSAAALGVILRAVSYHPRRLYRRVAMHIRMALRLNGDARLQLVITEMIHLATMSSTPALRARRCPRCVTSALVAVLRTYRDPASGNEEDPFFVAYNTLADICTLDSRVTLHAIQKGVFTILASVTTLRPQRDIERLVSCIKD
ncbi:hypothetical protein BD626DRAFT_635353 [Schizophyllum amplum]|uniref:Uncharacterized protein n=1 Tax=Schizophyllum amplum TaxID=97359 RepID=A0A550BWE0_9AGAR|nr:hypothetical protein BD626DRAFT_635353 [Auriculariopsis ampla]